MLFVIAALYVLSGPLLTLWGMRAARGRREERGDDAKPGAEPPPP